MNQQIPCQLWPVTGFNLWGGPRKMHTLLGLEPQIDHAMKSAIKYLYINIFFHFKLANLLDLLLLEIFISSFNYISRILTLYIPGSSHGRTVFLAPKNKEIKYFPKDTIPRPGLPSTTNIRKMAHYLVVMTVEWEIAFIMGFNGAQIDH